MVDRIIEQNMNVAGMRIIQWKSGVTRKDRIRNVIYVRGSIGVVSIVDNMRENILRGFWNVMRREEINAVRVVMKINVEGEKRSPKKRWLDMIGIKMRAVGGKWRFRSRMSDSK
jgi:hypothetical protein